MGHLHPNGDLCGFHRNFIGLLAGMVDVVVAFKDAVVFMRDRKTPYQ